MQAKKEVYGTNSSVLKNGDEGVVGGVIPVELETAVAIAKRLSTTARTIQRMFRDGLIPGYRVSRKLIRFRWSEINEALARIRIPANSET